MACSWAPFIPWSDVLSYKIRDGNCSRLLLRTKSMILECNVDAQQLQQVQAVLDQKLPENAAASQDSR